MASKQFDVSSIKYSSSSRWNCYQIGNRTFKDMEAYKMALTTKYTRNKISCKCSHFWSKHVLRFVCASVGAKRNEPTVQDCMGQVKPVEGATYPGSKPPGEAVVRTVLNNIDKPATLLNILLLTQLRKDGHPSRGRLDCSHCCLVGFPYTWNQLLYTTLNRVYGFPFSLFSKATTILCDI